MNFFPQNFDFCEFFDFSYLATSDKAGIFVFWLKKEQFDSENWKKYNLTQKDKIIWEKAKIIALHITLKR